MAHSLVGARGWTVFLSRHVLVGRVRRDGQDSHPPFRQHTQPSILLVASAQYVHAANNDGEVGVRRVQDAGRIQKPLVRAENLVRSLSREGEIMVSRPQKVSPKIIFARHLYAALCKHQRPKSLIAEKSRGCAVPRVTSKYMNEVNARLKNRGVGASSQAAKYSSHSA